MSEDKLASRLKRVWRCCHEWVAPFVAAAVLGFLIVGLACILLAINRNVALMTAIAAGLAIGGLALLIQPVRGWFVRYGYLFDPGSGWT